ncbi:MAG: fasciclin domain-containing protein [Flavobacteriaceae bacterium]
MYIFKIIFVFSVITLIVSSCKQNDKEAASEKGTEITKSAEKLPQKVLSEEDKKVITSVLSKMMVTPELKTFTSCSVTVEITDLLSKEEGPFTVLGFSNTAYETVPENIRNPLLRPENKETFAKLIKNHVVKGGFSSSDLVKNMKSTGNVILETLGGAKLTVSKEGTDIVISDSKGKKPRL